MSERPRHDLGARGDRVRDMIRGLPTATADPTFQEQLRREFADGSIESREPQRARPTSVRRWMWIPAAAALALAVGYAVNRGPDWVLSPEGSRGPFAVDGHMIDSTRMPRTVPGRARVSVPQGSELELVSEGTLILQLTPGTELSLPTSPGRWLGRSVLAKLGSGEVRIATGSRFRGARFDVETPEARIVVSGTTLTVIRDSSGTCVCVYDGHVVMIDSGGPGTLVTPGERRLRFHDGSTRREPILPMERMKLEMLHDRAQPMLRR